MKQEKAIKYFSLAKHLADSFSKDASTKVGAIFLAPESLQILSMGYNGMPRGFDETKQERWLRPQKYLYVEHAERNAIYNACRHGTPLENSIAVVTMFPCSDCMRALIQSGVKQIITLKPDLECKRWGTHFKASMEMCTECHVELIFVDVDDSLDENHDTPESMV